MIAPAAITLTMILHHEERAGIFVSLDGDAASAVVLPLSQIVVEPGRGRQVRVTLPAWLARKRNLITAPDGRQGRLL